MSVIEKITEWFLARENPAILEFGSHKFRMIDGKFKASQPEITYSASVDAPEGCVLSNQLEQFIFDSEIIKSTLKKLFNNRFLEEKYVAVVLPDQAFCFGSFPAPPAVLKTGIQSHLEKEVQKNTGLPYKNYIIRYEIGKKYGNKIPIHYCALPGGILSDIQQICSETGLIPLSVQPSFVGLVKLLRVSQTDPKQSSVLVHIGNETTTAGVYGTDGLKHAQLVNMGITDFARCLEEKLELTREQAIETLNNELILLDDPTADVQLEIDNYRLLEPVFADFLQKLYGLLLLYTNEHPEDSRFARIVLSGGGARIKNLDRLIASNLGLETILLTREVAATFENVAIPVGESIESLAPLIGNLLLEPWRADRHERIVAA